MHRFKLFSAAILVAALAASCNSKKNGEGAADSDSLASTSSAGSRSSGTASTVVPGQYTSLETGQPVYIIEDPETGYAVDSLTKLPVTFYVNTEGDTLTNTGVVAHELMKADDGSWTISENAKIKVDGDKIKIKDGDTKIKIDGDDTKIKDGDYKMKSDADKDKAKEKSGDIKVKEKEGDVKVKP